MANFFCSAGYNQEKIHTGMIAYLCDLWNEGDKEPLDFFLDRLELSLGNTNELQVHREGEKIDLLVCDASSQSPVLAIEMKVDSGEGIARGTGKPQTIAYPKLLPEGILLLYVTLGTGEFYHEPQGKAHGSNVRWIKTRDFHDALQCISSGDPFVEKWREAVGKELKLQEKCFSYNTNHLREYRGRTWSLYFLGHLKERLLDSLSGRGIGIDPFVYPLSAADTILFFGRGKIPAYLEINNNGLLNLKVFLKDLESTEAKEKRWEDANAYYQPRLRDYNPKRSTKNIRSNAKSKTVMSFDVGLVPDNGNLFYSTNPADQDHLLAEEHTIERLTKILESFYCSPPFEDVDIDPIELPPHFDDSHSR